MHNPKKSYNFASAKGKKEPFNFIIINKMINNKNYENKSNRRKI